MNEYPIDLDELIRELDNKFDKNGTWFKWGSHQRESVLGVIKSYFLKKNLVILPKVEYDRIKTSR